MHAKQQQYAAGSTQRGSDWIAIGIQIGAATIFSGVIAYVATNPQQLAQAVTDSHIYTPAPARAPASPLPPPPPPAVQGEPVKVANPFDASEVFQFPAGTTATDAHLAVAGILLQRARDRQDEWSRSQHRSKKPASQPASDETVLAQASTG
ncbi:MAG: hypothetical protein JSR66_04815 [Proteobacteria bacterium]|nr:hypothetical protein [Pseudomonadota bacterium]